MKQPAPIVDHGMERLDINAVGGITNITTIGNIETDTDILFRSSYEPTAITLAAIGKEILRVYQFEQEFEQRLLEADYEEMLYTDNPAPAVQAFIDYVQQIAKEINDATIRNASRLASLNYKQAMLEEEAAREGRIIVITPEQAKYKIEEREILGRCEYMLSCMESVSQIELAEIMNGN